MKVLSRKREEALIERWVAGDSQARDAIILAHVPMAENYAERFTRSCPWLRDDAIQHAKLALVMAAERFEPERGFRFCTYARWWVRSLLVKLVHTNKRGAHLPRDRHTRRVTVKLRNARMQLSQELSRDPTIDELAEHIGVASKYVSTVIAHNDFSEQPPDDVPTIGRAADEIVNGWEENMLLAEALDTLTSRQREVMRLRMDGLTLIQVAERLGVSRERVRQIQIEAIETIELVLERHFRQTG